MLADLILTNIFVYFFFMTRKEEGDFLKKRGELFLKEGRRLLKEKVYDLAAFHLEQSTQLFLKYTLFLKIGDYPRTHSLRVLLAQLSTVAKGEKQKIEKILEEKIETISNLEDTYFTSRYFPKEFTEKEWFLWKNLSVNWLLF